MGAHGVIIPLIPPSGKFILALPPVIRMITPMHKTLIEARVEILEDLIRAARVGGRRAHNPLLRIASGEAEMILRAAQESARAGREIIPGADEDGAEDAPPWERQATLDAADR
jgi:hypothetical protein